MASLVTSTVNANTVWHAGNYGRVIDRGNPGSGTALALTSLDEVHYYSASSISTIDISTTMVENAVYQLSYTTNGTGATNIDIYLIPNYTSYASEFRSTYWASMPSVSPPRYEFLDQALSYFYYDHQNGSAGTSPSGTFLIYNFRALKQTNYFGGDTNSVCSGTSRWNNTTTQWTNVGTLGGLQTATDVKVWVRRIS